MAVYQRGQVWWAAFSINGHRYRRSTKLTSRARAIEYENRLRSELYDLHALGRTKQMLFGEAMDRYVETVLQPKRRKQDGKLRHSSKNDLLRIKVVESYFGREATLPHVGKPGAISQFNFHLMKRMQPQSANRYLSLVRAILNKTYEWGALSQPPIIRLNREKRHVNRALTDLEERRLLEIVTGRLHDLVIFVLDTGARREEAFELTWEHVDLDRKPRPIVYFIDTKNGDHRCVPVPKRTAKLLRWRKRLYGGRSKLVFSFPAHKDIYNNRGVLYARKGTLIPFPNFQLTWRAVKEQLGLLDLRLHDLRHTYATKLVRRGVPLVDVSKLLGHHSIRMTLRYAYLAVEELDSAVAVLDEPQETKRVGRHRYRPHRRINRFANEIQPA